MSYKVKFKYSAKVIFPCFFFHTSLAQCPSVGENIAHIYLRHNKKKSSPAAPAASAAARGPSTYPMFKPPPELACGETRNKKHLEDADTSASLIFDLAIKTQ